MSSQHDSNAKPDLDDEVNVAEAHSGLEGATAATNRERRLHENGMEPVPLWLFLAAGLSLLVGGAVLGKGGGLFTYNQKSMWADAYIEPELGDAEEATEGPALKFFVSQGKKVYSKCIGCHGADGSGGGVFPPLAGSEWVMEDRTEALGMIILNGLKGPIEVAGKTWDIQGGMQSQAPLAAKELAPLMTYLRSGLNDVGDVVSLAQAQTAIDAYEARGTSGQVTFAILKNHLKGLEGEAMDPTTVIDFETYEPVGE